MRLKRGTKDWDRFWSKVKKGPGCWEWQGSRTGRYGKKQGGQSYGYGRMWLNRKSKCSHRIAWEMGHGKIPNKMCVCHHCDNPPCVRPSHLFLGTPKENHQDSINKGRQIRAKGSKHKLSKLSEIDIPKIRKDKRTLKQIAKDYGVTYGVIGGIKRRETWKHIKEVT